MISIVIYDDFRTSNLFNIDASAADSKSYHDCSTMNRDEQESLYRTSRTLSLVPSTASKKTRHYSHGNIHQIHIPPGSPYCSRVGVKSASVKLYPDTDEELEHGEGREDLVLSVLKSPLNHIDGKKHKH